MGAKLLELIGDSRSLSLAGMCKNAGKTTVLNQIIKELNTADKKMGLTSIGRDGEACDVVTGTFKPEIFVHADTLIATAAGLLSACDITKEILAATGIQTPMGEIVIVKALSDGRVQLAGPSTNTQLIQISNIFAGFGTEKIVIDGAISRKSLCSTKVAQSVILCSGASYHRNMDVVVEDTRFWAEVLSLQTVEIKEIISVVKKRFKENTSPNRHLLFDKEGNPLEGGSQSLGESLGEEINKKWHYCYLEGAVTDTLMKPLIMSNIKLKNKFFAAEDSSKIMLSNDVYTKLKMKGAAMRVLAKTDLLAVTVNPFSVYGNHFNKEVFMEKMKEKIQGPVFNVMEEEQ